MGNAVSKQIATEEITKWLDSKGVRAKKRKENEDSIDELIEAVEEGYLVVDHDSNELVLQLATPLGSDGQIKEFRFKPRLTVGEVHPFLKKLKAGDVDGRLLAYAQALTSQPAAVINSMDTGDQGLITTIALFFL